MLRSLIVAKHERLLIFAVGLNRTNSKFSLIRSAQGLFSFTGGLLFGVLLKSPLQVVPLGRMWHPG